MSARETVITRVSPLSAFRVALSLSLAGLVAWLVCVVVLYLGMDATGVWDNINSVIGGIGGEQAIGFGMVITAALLIGVITTVLLTALAPIVAMIYNATVGLAGGLEVTLEDLR